MEMGAMSLSPPDGGILLSLRSSTGGSVAKKNPVA
jgi:hypothetical protein